MTRKYNYKDKNKVGSPCTFTKEIGDMICERVATNPIGLIKICKMYDDMPSHHAINQWRHKYKDFDDQYLLAKIKQAILMVEQIDDLLDHPVIYNTDEKGQQKIDPPSASMAIARCNNRKWQVARLAPKMYGDRHIEEVNDNMQAELQTRKQTLDEKNKKEY